MSTSAITDTIADDPTTVTDTAGPGSFADRNPQTDETGDPEPIIEKIRSLKRTDSFADGMPDPARLPGFGFAYDDCHDTMPWLCPGCGDTVPGPNNCKRPSCPECAPWYIATQIGPNIVGKLEAIRRVRNSFKVPNQKFHHIVVSPPDDLYLDADNWTKKVVEVIKKIGEGDDWEGYWFQHQYRGADHDVNEIGDVEPLGVDEAMAQLDGEFRTEEIRSIVQAVLEGDDLDEYDDYWVNSVLQKLPPERVNVGAMEEFDDSRAHDDDRGLWKRLLFAGLDWDEAKEQLKYSPHFHVIAVGDRVIGGDDVARIQDETGWVIHRITKKNSKVSLYDQFDLARAVTYCLSHTAVREDSNGDLSLQCDYFGSVANDATTEDANDDLDAKAKDWVATVAPLTLGIPFEKLVCSREYEADADDRLAEADHDCDDDCSCDHDHGDAVRESAVDVNRSGPGGGGNPWSSGGYAGELPDDQDGLGDADDDLPDAPDDDVEGEQTAVADVDDGGGTCHHRYVPIHKAPKFLDNDEWCAQAPHADTLQTTFDEWAAETEWYSAGGG